MRIPKDRQRAFLLGLAARAMRERGFEPEFPPAVMAMVGGLPADAPGVGPGQRDARDLLWCSIDNDDSRDLDQLTAAEALDDGRTRILVAVADVCGTVPLGSAPDRHARVNTTSVYTPPRVFPMLPERLSTDLTSLNPGVDRSAFVIEAVVSSGGEVESSDVYRALVRNRAQLAYPGVGAWLADKGPMPERLAGVPGLAESLRLQSSMAHAIDERRHELGSLDFAPIEVKAVFEGDVVHALQRESQDPASKLIENFMIAANGVIARFLTGRRFPVLRRVVKSPKRWGRIVEIAGALGTELPVAPDVKALQGFLQTRRRADPVHYPDLSLSIIKLLGRGEYVVSIPGEESTGHFSLAVSEYTHSTAPNRRYPDLITQRLLRAALEGERIPYLADDLRTLAEHCTIKEGDAKRVERRLVKSAAALLLEGRNGEEFDGIVTGASEKGTWVRILDPPVEGRVESPGRDLDVGDQVRVKLIRTNPELGYIDFDCVGHEPVGRRRRGSG